MATLYRAEVIGSLLRPGYLKEARQKWESGQLSTRDFKRIEDRAVDEALALQQQAGVDVVTDGEMRRTHFIAPLTDVISGIKPFRPLSGYGDGCMNLINPLNRPKSRSSTLWSTSSAGFAR
jgi:methionine synthase II (cobalamin-independent)